MITYILHFLNATGQQRNLLLQPIDAGNGVILEETYDGSGIVRGQSVYGTNFEVKFDQILKIEEYKVTANWGGRGHSTRNMTGEAIAEYTKNAGGEAEKISQVKDVKGNVVYDKNDKT